jgi:uncharacterized membrane protein YeaQ/YmgE (transglycosylase-associated protein family)
MLIDYAGMNAAEIAAWLLIATATGFVGRAIVKGKKILGLWGDAAIGLVGAFLAGTLMRAFSFDLTAWLLGFLPKSMADFAMWIDIGISSLVGAIIIRAIMRPFTGGG